MFREIRNAWDFRLVLCADVSEPLVAHSIETLEDIVDDVHPLRKPLILSERRTLRTRSTDRDVGWSREWSIPASAL